MAGLLYAALLALAAAGGERVTVCDPNDFTGSDLERIEAAIRAARGAGGTVRIPARRPDSACKRDYWLLDTAIRIPSDTTLILDGCRIKLSDRCRDNFIRSANCGHGVADIPIVRNIRILGVGGATLEGADDPRATGDSAKTLGTSPKQSYGSDAGKSGETQNGDWRNIGILLVNVENFALENLTIRDSHAWAVSLEYCAHGRIADLNFISSGSKMVNGKLVTVLNQDGLDLRRGCHDIDVDTIRGTTGDDVVALTALVPRRDHAPGEYGFTEMSGCRKNMRENDVFGIRIRNVIGYCAGGHHIVRFLNSSGVRMYDIELENLLDTSPAGFRCRAAVKIGDANPAWGGVTPLGDTARFRISNVCSRARDAILVAGSLTDSEISNMTNLNPETTEITLQSGPENVRNVRVDGNADIGK